VSTKTVKYGWPAASEALANNKPLALIPPDAVMWPAVEPETDIFPVNVWISSEELPNWVDPLV